jgi:hypothetical protein
MTEQNQIRQPENKRASPQGHTGSARYSAEREERNDKKPMVSWAALLNEAVTKPLRRRKCIDGLIRTYGFLVHHDGSHAAEFWVVLANLLEYGPRMLLVQWCLSLKPMAYFAQSHINLRGSKLWVISIMIKVLRKNHPDRNRSRLVGRCWSTIWSTIERKLRVSRR